MPDQTHVFLLASHAFTLILAAVYCHRSRRHAEAANWARNDARFYGRAASGHADRAAEGADRAERQANRATREATRAINSNDARARAVSLDEEPDVIPFARPTGPRLADLDEPA